MIVYTCAFTNDEVCSDSYPTQILHDVVMQVEGKFIIKGAENYGIEGEDVDDQAQKVINIVDCHRLSEIKMSKKDVMTYVKQYCGKIVAHLTAAAEASTPASSAAPVQGTPAERLAIFKKNAPVYVKELLANFDEYTVYHSENGLEHFALIFCKWSADGLTPCFQYFADGLTAVKY